MVNPLRYTLDLNVTTNVAKIFPADRGETVPTPIAPATGRSTYVPAELQQLTVKHEFPTVPTV
jgi:hypothetical protein